MTTTPSIVLVPIKSFDTAKSRLRHALSANELEQLSRELARAVIEACAPRACLVLCDSEEIVEFARSFGAEAALVSSLGLNPAVSEGYRRVGGSYEQVIIAHADLATPSGLGDYEFGEGLTIVTDRHGRGTNVMAIPTGLEFHFAYGENSAAQHRAEGERSGLAVSSITNSPWGLDIDDPEDLKLRNR